MITLLFELHRPSGWTQGGRKRKFRGEAIGAKDSLTMSRER
jgi:hypothetical protein